MWKVLYSLLGSHTELVHCPRGPLRSTCSSVPCLPRTPDNNGSSYFLHGFPFSTKPCSWTQTVHCGLFPVTLLTEQRASEAPACLFMTLSLNIILLSARTSLPTPPPAGGHLGCSQFWLIVNQAATNIYLQDFIKGATLSVPAPVWLWRPLLR